MKGDSMSPDITSTTVSNETQIGELRKQHGEHFAPGYESTDTLGHLLGNAGVATLDEYLMQNAG
jgi:hypothetical protein